MPIAPEVLTMAVDITKETIRSSGGKLEEPEKAAMRSNLAADECHFPLAEHRLVHFDVVETCLGAKSFDFLDFVKPLDLLRILRKRLCVSWAESQHQTGSGPHDPSYLPQAHYRLIPEVDGMNCEHLVEVCVGIGELTAIAERQFYSAIRDPFPVVPCGHLQHSARRVDSRYTSFGHESCEIANSSAMTKTYFEDSVTLAWSQEADRETILRRSLDCHDASNNSAQDTARTTALTRNEGWTFHVSSFRPFV